MKLFLFLFILTLFAIGRADTHTATSASQADIFSAIDSSTYNDTIIIPPDTVTWDSANGRVGYLSRWYLMVLRKGTTIIGSTGNGAETKINIPITYTKYGFNVWYDSGTINNDYMVDISGLVFDVDSGRLSNGGIISINASDTLITRNLKIHNNTFFDCQSKAIVVNGLAYGVIYDNIFTDVGYSVTAFGSDYYAWERISKGCGTMDNLFVEDNLSNFTKNYSGTRSGGTDHGQGAPGFVYRYNTIDYTNTTGAFSFIVHGLQTMDVTDGYTCPSGCGYVDCTPSRVGSCDEAAVSCEQWSTIKSEYYGNLLLNGTFNSLMALRGGVLMMYNNFLTTSGSLPSITYNQYSCNSCQSPFRGIEYDQKVKGTYVFSNYGNTTRIDMTKGLDYCGDYSIGQPYAITKNRDYWNEETIFSDSGVGVGTLIPTMAARDSSGYWVSSGAGTIQTTMDGIKAVTQTGDFYIRTNGLWFKSYEPAKYPHPLRNQHTQCIITIRRP